MICIDDVIFGCVQVNRMRIMSCVLAAGVALRKSIQPWLD
jgi:hypothetical protein